MAAAMISALSSGCHIHLHNAIKNNREYTDMNEINIKKFLQVTEEYLRQHQQDLSPSDLDSVNELYEDLAAELSRQQMFDDLYH